MTIQKSHIKELGVDNVHTSDLSVDVLNVNGYPPEKVERDADLLATALNDLGFTFPVRVFTQCRGHRFSGPSDSDRAAVDYLLEQVTSSTAPTHTELVLAARELYAVVDSCDVVLNAMDIRGA